MTKITTYSIITGMMSLLSFQAAAQTFLPQIDTSFKTGDGFNPNVQTLVLQPDGKIIAGGSFTSFDGVTSLSRVARLNNDGTLDQTFSTGDITGPTFPKVAALAVQADGKILAGGNFTEYDGTPQAGLVRLHPDGSRDTSFKTGAGFERNSGIGTVSALIVQDDGKIIVGGYFNKYDGATAESIVRLDTNGDIDPSFATGSGFINREVYVMTLQDDGKILIGGNFDSYNGTQGIRKLVRLNSDGTIDNTFKRDFGFGGSSTIHAIEIMAGGNIVVGGNFLNFGAESARSIVMLKADGSRDSSFQTATGFENSVWAVKELPDGKLLVGGLFQKHDTVKAERLVVLNPDGTRNMMFPSTFGFSQAVTCLAIQDDGKAVAGGLFTAFMPVGTYAAGYIARIIFDQSASVDPIQESAVKMDVFPNPARSVIYISLDRLPDDIHKSIVNVVDITGKNMLTQMAGDVLYDRMITLDIRHLPAGMYFINLHTSQGKYTHKASIY